MKTLYFLDVGKTGAAICSVHWSMGNAPKYAKDYRSLWERKKKSVGGGEKGKNYIQILHKVLY